MKTTFRDWYSPFSLLVRVDVTARPTPSSLCRAFLGPRVALSPPRFPAGRHWGRKKGTRRASSRTSARG